MNEQVGPVIELYKLYIDVQYVPITREEYCRHVAEALESLACAGQSKTK